MTIDAMICGGPAPTWLTPEDLAREDQWCCAGAAMFGPDRCTCWEEVYDRRQSQRLVEGPMPIRDSMCGDCAYRPQSQEYQAAGGPPDYGTFVCHQGLRRIVAMRHPDGRYRPLPDGYGATYDPPARPPVAWWRTDGQPASLCAGWARITARTGR